MLIEIFICCRLRKSSSPSKWWARTGGTPPSLPRAPRPAPRARSLDRSHPPSPPTPPQPPSLASETLASHPHATNHCPNPKSRSYNNILDSDEKSLSNTITNDNSPERDIGTEHPLELTRSCEDELDRLDEDSSEQSEPPRRAQSCEGLLQASPRQSSMLSLQPDSPGGTKRKKNFMDRCVHKVRSLVLRK